LPSIRTTPWYIVRELQSSLIQAFAHARWFEQDELGRSQVALGQILSKVLFSCGILGWDESGSVRRMLSIAYGLVIAVIS
jgi:hypothetical protein